MAITLENKAKFFGQHWGQKVRFWTFNGPDILSKVGHTYMSKSILKGCSLYLKNIQSITDQDAIQVAYYLGWDDHTNKVQLSAGLDFINGGSDGCDLDNYTQVVDYLRSKGYALPWMGLSVEQMVQEGWIKLTTP